MTIDAPEEHYIFLNSLAKDSPRRARTLEACRSEVESAWAIPHDSVSVTNLPFFDVVISFCKKTCPFLDDYFSSVGVPAAEFAVCPVYGDGQRTKIKRITSDSENAPPVIMIMIDVRLLYEVFSLFLLSPLSATYANSVEKAKTLLRIIAASRLSGSSNRFAQRIGLLLQQPEELGTPLFSDYTPTQDIVELVNASFADRMTFAVVVHSVLGYVTYHEAGHYVCAHSTAEAEEYLKHTTQVAREVAKHYAANPELSTQKRNLFGLNIEITEDMSKHVSEELGRLSKEELIAKLDREEVLCDLIAIQLLIADIFSLELFRPNDLTLLRFVFGITRQLSYMVSHRSNWNFKFLHLVQRQMSDTLHSLPEHDYDEEVKSLFEVLILENNLQEVRSQLGQYLISVVWSKHLESFTYKKLGLQTANNIDLGWFCFGANAIENHLDRYVSIVNHELHKEIFSAEFFLRLLSKEPVEKPASDGPPIYNLKDVFSVYMFGRRVDFFRRRELAASNAEDDKLRNTEESIIKPPRDER